MKKNLFLSVLSAAFCLSMILFISAFAQEDFANAPSEEKIAAMGITYPVSELGNCSSKQECKNYCNEAGHMSECIAFAKKRGLMTEQDAERADKFASQVVKGEGPGGCDSPNSCEAYCSELSHIDECTSFAEKNDFTENKNFKQGKKIAAYLKSGGSTPGQCKNKQECEAYCEDFSHAKECFEFAKKAGIADQISADMKGDMSMRRDNGRSAPREDQLERMMELVSNGQTPGGCKSKKECEAYCSAEGHMQECMEFGVKAGFMTQDEAEKIKQVGGKGPGGCNSPNSCHQYCNDPSHQDECFQFAEEHGFISKEESSQTKDGWNRARHGFKDAPPEIRDCIKTALGESILSDIQAGKLVPGPDISGRVRGCFDKFQGNAHPREGFSDVSPEAMSCLREKFGDDFDKIRSGEKPHTPEIAEAFHACVQSKQMPGTRDGDMKRESGPNAGETGMNRNGNPSHQMLEQMLRNAPSQIRACIEQKIGSDMERLQSGQSGTEARDLIQQIIKTCTESSTAQFPPNTRTEGSAGPAPEGGHQQPPGGMGAHMPLEVRRCVHESVGEEAFAGMQSGAASEEIKAKIKDCFERHAGAQQQGTDANHPAPSGQESVPGDQRPPDTQSPPAEMQTDTMAPVSLFLRLVSAVAAPFRWLLGNTLLSH